MNKVTFLSILLFMSCVCSTAIADPVTSGDVSKAQEAMINRVSKEVDQYAKKIGMSQSWVSYCWSELHLHTYQHPPNGEIHFGVDYINF